MVNPRWRPTIANSRKTTKSKQKNLPPFLKKKILAAKPNKKTKSKA